MTFLQIFLSGLLTYFIIRNELDYCFWRKVFFLTIFLFKMQVVLLFFSVSLWEVQKISNKYSGQTRQLLKQQMWQLHTQYKSLILHMLTFYVIHLTWNTTSSAIFVLSFKVLIPKMAHDTFKINHIQIAENITFYFHWVRLNEKIA
jgi:hypothetical protein